MPCLNKGVIAVSSGKVWCTSYRNEKGEKGISDFHF